MIYEQSLFGRLIYFLEHQNRMVPLYRLDTQYRMHPEIAAWPAKYFYNGNLKNGPNTKTETGLRPLVLINVKGKIESEEEDKCHKYYNKSEERVCMAAVDSVRELNKELNIGIITFYAEQKENILKDLREGRKHQDMVNVNTVDSYQGSESDVIIISCVRTGPGSNIGFLNDKKRLNVALTRAKHCLIVIGDFHHLR